MGFRCESLLVAALVSSLYSVLQLTLCWFGYVRFSMGKEYVEAFPGLDTFYEVHLRVHLCCAQNWLGVTVPY